MHTHTHKHMNIHTGLSCGRRGRGERSHICYCSGDRLVFISMAFICTRPPRLSFFLPQNGEETHQLMFSFTVIGWFKAASVNCAPPSHPPHCSPSAFGLPQLPPLLLTPFLFAFALFNFFSSKWSNGLCVRVLARWCWMRDILRLFCSIEDLRRIKKSPSGYEIICQHF